MTAETLARSPFGSYLVPGSCCSPWSAARRPWRVGGAATAGPRWVAVRGRGRRAGWVDHRAGGDDRARHPMQPSLFVAGVVIAGLGWMRTRRRRRSASPQPSGTSEAIAAAFHYVHAPVNSHGNASIAEKLNDNY